MPEVAKHLALKSAGHDLLKFWKFEEGCPSGGHRVDVWVERTDPNSANWCIGWEVTENDERHRFPDTEPPPSYACKKIKPTPRSAEHWKPKVWGMVQEVLRQKEREASASDAIKQLSLGDDVNQHCSNGEEDCNSITMSLPLKGVKESPHRVLATAKFEIKFVIPENKKNQIKSERLKVYREGVPEAVVELFALGRKKCDKQERLLVMVSPRTTLGLDEVDIDIEDLKVMQVVALHFDDFGKKFGQIPGCDGPAQQTIAEVQRNIESAKESGHPAQVLSLAQDGLRTHSDREKSKIFAISLVEHSASQPEPVSAVNWKQVLEDLGDAPDSKVQGMCVEAQLASSGPLDVTFVPEKAKANFKSWNTKNPKEKMAISKLLASTGHFYEQQQEYDQALARQAHAWRLGEDLQAGIDAARLLTSREAEIPGSEQKLEELAHSLTDSEGPPQDVVSFLRRRPVQGTKWLIPGGGPSGDVKAGYLDLFHSVVEGLERLNPSPQRAELLAMLRQKTIEAAKDLYQQQPTILAGAEAEQKAADLFSARDSEGGKSQARRGYLRTAEKFCESGKLGRAAENLRKALDLGLANIHALKDRSEAVSRRIESETCGKRTD